MVTQVCPNYDLRSHHHPPRCGHPPASADPALSTSVTSLQNDDDRLLNGMRAAQPADRSAHLSPGTAGLCEPRACCPRPSPSFLPLVLKPEVCGRRHSHCSRHGRLATATSCHSAPAPSVPPTACTSCLCCPHTSSLPRMLHPLAPTMSPTPSVTVHICKCSFSPESPTRLEDIDTTSVDSWLQPASACQTMNSERSRCTEPSPNPAEDRTDQ